MLTSSVGVRNSVRRIQNSEFRIQNENSVRVRQRGVTLLEMLIVVTLIAIVAGLSLPSISSGLDSLRLRSASDSIVALLNTSLDRADRRQQAVEILISPRDNAIVARSADQ